MPLLAPFILISRYGGFFFGYQAVASAGEHSVGIVDPLGLRDWLIAVSAGLVDASPGQWFQPGSPHPENGNNGHGFAESCQVAPLGLDCHFCAG
ncbi:hypothetical protein FHS61_000698 [Altererythrobacter atlanticus]|nr:hypothetical protein [Croceibacterium atlanticum]